MNCTSVSFCSTASSYQSHCDIGCYNYALSVLRWGLCASVDKAVHKETADVEVGPVSCEYTAAVSPWQSEATCTSDLSVSLTSFADIVRDELLQTATFEHTTKKSLALIQVQYLRH